MCTTSARHVGTPGRLAREHVNTQDKLAREHVNTQGTLACEHVFGTQFNRLVYHISVSRFTDLFQ